MYIQNDFALNSGENNKVEDITQATSIIQKYWGTALQNLTINGNGNRIIGSSKDDSIEVRGDKNYVNLGLGKNDKLKIYGNNNTVEDPDGINVLAADKPIKYIEESQNADGSKVKTIGYEDGSKDVIYSYNYMNRQEVINYDSKGNVVGGNVTGSDESTLWGGPTQKYKTKAEAELALKKFVNEWTSSYTEKYLETSTFWLKMLAEKTNLGDDKYIDITNAQTKILTTAIKQNKDGSYYFEAKVSQSFDFNVLDKKII